MNAPIRRCCWLLLGVICALPVLADDIDIYNNPAANGLQPPATIIVLDLNLVGICDNVLTDPGGSTVAYGSSNPYGAQACLNLQQQTLNVYLSSIGLNPTAVLTGSLTSLGASGLCGLYTLLGISSPVLSAGLLGSLTCNTLSGILGLLPASLLTSFTSTLVSGLISPLLSTLLNRLPTAVTGALDATLSGAQKVLADPLSIATLSSVLGNILNNLINSKVAVVVSHANYGTTISSGGKSYVCAFKDLLGTGNRASSTACSNGAYVLFGFTALVDATTVTTLLNKITNKLTSALSPSTLTATLTGLTTSLLTSSNLTPPYQGKEIYDEILHYLFGDAVYNGPLNSYDGVMALLTRDTTIETSTNLATDKYVLPAVPCNNVNVLNIQATNSSAFTDGDSDPDLVANYFPGISLNLPAITGDSDPGFTNLVGAAQTTGVSRNGGLIKLNSYFLIQQNLSSLAALSNVGANVTSYANSLGLLGLGQTVAQNMQPSLIVNASLVSASTSSSLGATTNGLLPPAFFSIFKPEASAGTAQTAGTAKPGWFGNLKRLDLDQITNITSSAYNTYIYTDAGCSDASAAAGSCASAIASDGRIATTAKTFWTLTGSSKLGTNSVDGREATLGGAGQNIPGYVYGGGGNPGRKNADSIRQLYYDSLTGSSNVPALAALDADNAAGTFNTTSNAERNELSPYLSSCPTTANDTTCQALLLFARGFNVGTTAAPVSSLSSVTSRNWMLGAVLHARPVAINYGARSGYSRTDPDVRVLFGSADGYLHMVKNGPAASPSGQEVWAFMPKAVMGNLKTLRDDGYSSPNNLAFPYGVDGAPQVLVKNLNSSTGVPGNVYAFFGLRRGAATNANNSYYALDLSNPDAPKLMWTLSKAGVYSANYASPGLISASTSQFSELGQSFSSPAIGKVLLKGETTPRSVLIFGGGYNGSVNGTKLGKDLNNSRNTTASAQVGQNDSIGNAIYMVDAMTGELLWKAAYGTTTKYTSGTLTYSHPLIQDSIPSDITAVDTDGDGYTDRFYVGDTGGHVWRGDLGTSTTGADRSTWSLSLLASLGRHASTSGSNTIANDRRFFHAPDYVPTRDPVSYAAYDAVVIASGDREDPFNTSTQNDLFVLRDKDIVSGKDASDTTDSNGIISSETDARLLVVAGDGTRGVAQLPASCTGTTSTSCIASSVATNTAANLADGWQLSLSSSGEKATSAPVTVGSTVTLSSFVPPASNANSCTPSEGGGKLYALNLDDGHPTVALFGTDADGDSRSSSLLAPGIPGELNAVTTDTLNVDAQTLTVQVVPYYRVYWRERRGDEEKPVPQ